MMTRVPGTANGVRLKSKFPKRQAWADNLGCLREDRRRLREMSHWARR